MFARIGSLILLTLFSIWAFAQSVQGVRFWPGPDYTRMTLEMSDKPVFTQLMLDNPRRLVLDLEGVRPEGALAMVAESVPADSPSIGHVRVALNRPGVTRLVVELKAAVAPKVFVLAPMGAYQHRLVVDLYPPKGAKPNTPVIKAAPEQPQVTSGVTPPNACQRTVTVAIDAGHGGEDPGAKGARGSLEKEITLSMARRVKAMIDRTEGMKAVLVRDGDYFIPLHQRVKKAYALRADLFVSIHADAFMREDAHGSSVFALSERGGTSATARWLAKKENEADLVGGYAVKHDDPQIFGVLMEMSHKAQIADSVRLAKSVHKEIAGVNHMHKPYFEQAGFAVLKAPDIPSILVETAFISNPEEERRLNDPDYQERLATAIVEGIRAYRDTCPQLTKLPEDKETP